jgi:hypothetical protein
MRFKDFLYEKKKVVEPAWADDYESGYARLKDLQKYCAEKNMGPQLFVPKFRDPKLMKKRMDDVRWREVKREIPDEVKESASIPILTTYKEQPPGDNKPSNAFWTSTAIPLKDGRYTSDWYKFVHRVFPEWQTDYGYLFEVDHSALVMKSGDLDQFYEWVEFAGKITKEVPDWAKREWSATRMRTNYPWDVLARHFDGVRHHGYSHGYDDFTYGWDVESTAWFNTKYLKYKGAVKLSTYEDDE